MDRVIRNPVLPGSHPDPDLIRGPDGFYLATTTFEWLPGIRIHHSTDLVNWRLVAAPLDGRRIGDLRAVPDSGGNYIPSLSWHDGRFYLVYSIVLDRTWPWMANRTFLTTAEDVRGPWSEPVHLNSMGFDPALFFHDDGTCWLLHLWLDHRPGREQMRGIHAHRLDLAKQELTGETREIFRSPAGWFAEGPHVFKRRGWYYLSTAIFGTYEKHATMVARSRDFWGPYEVDPGCPMLTSHGAPEHPLQKAGQGCFLDVGSDEWVLAHHASRLVQGRSPLGRETCLQRIVWNADGWPRLADGGVLPAVEIALPAVADSTNSSPAPIALRLDWSTLREPADHSWVQFEDDGIRLRGRLPITSKIGQSLVARRWPAMRFHAEVQVEFEARNEAQLAGLICYYDTADFIWAALTRDEERGRVLTLINRRSDQPFDGQFIASEPVPDGPVHLRVVVDLPQLQFHWRHGNGEWRALGPSLDATHLSDEGPAGKKNGFTGAFVGLAAQDHDRETLWANFRGWRMGQEPR